MSRVSPESTSAAIQEEVGGTRRGSLLQQGVFLPPYHDAAVWNMLNWTAAVGLLALVVHPAVASMFGGFVSKIFGIFVVALLLPSCRKIVIAPFVAIVVACLFIGAYNKSIIAVAVALPAYAIFYLLTYETKRFLRIILMVGAVAGLLALLQFLIPSPYLNIHATAQSASRFIDQYRPTSIFPTQAYYNQFLLLLIPIFFIAGERRVLVLALAGFSALITGATAGLVFVVLALFLGVRHIARYVFVGVIAALAFMVIVYPERLAYNFSLIDQIDSIGSRIKGAPLNSADAITTQAGSNEETTETTTTNITTEGAVTTKVITIAAPKGHPSLLIAVQVLAIAGLLLASMMTVRMAMPFSMLLPTGASLLAVFVGQLIHPTIGSLYFSMTLAVFTAVIWNFLIAFNKSMTGEELDEQNTVHTVQ